jgi:hypothetical protein
MKDCGMSELGARMRSSKASISDGQSDRVKETKGKSLSLFGCMWAIICDSALQA